MERPGLCCFAALMRGDPEELLERSYGRIVSTAESLVPFETKKELLAISLALADRRIKNKSLLNKLVTEIRSMGGNYVFDLLYKEGIEKGIEQGIEKGRERGLIEGQRKEARSAVERVLRRRFGALPDDIPGKLALVEDLAVLERLHDEAVVVPSLVEFLREMP